MLGLNPPHLERTVVMVLSIMLQAALYSAISKTLMPWLSQTRFIVKSLAQSYIHFITMIPALMSRELPPYTFLDAI